MYKYVSGRRTRMTFTTCSRFNLSRSLESTIIIRNDVRTHKGAAGDDDRTDACMILNISCVHLKKSGCFWRFFWGFFLDFFLDFFFHFYCRKKSEAFLIFFSSRNFAFFKKIQIFIMYFGLYWTRKGQSYIIGI